MMRSLYAGVAGLRTHQTKMDVLGNNIANVNTTSYKSQSITFSDLMYQTTQSASGATQTKGGVNARQIGLGAKSGAISTAIESQGATQTTNNPFDIMITGKAFFVINNGKDQLYTRDGSFYVDGAGNLAMQSTGYLVQGWVAQENKDTGELQVNKNGELSSLQIMTADNQTYAPASTTESVFSGNIDDFDTNVNSDDGKTVTLEFYDNKGYLYTAKFIIHNDDTNSEHFTLKLDDIIDSTGNSIGTEAMNATNFKKYGTSSSSLSNPGAYTIDTTTTSGKAYIKNAAGDTVATIPTTGKTSDLTSTYSQIMSNYFNPLTGINDIGSYTINANGTVTYTNTTATTDKEIDLYFDPAKGNITSANGAEDAQVSLVFNQDAVTSLKPFGYQVIGTQPSTEFEAGEMKIDFSSVTNVNTNGSSTIKAVKGNKKSLNTGREVGEMNGVNISTDGQIYATYSNGQTKLLGQIASAEFANASGLSKEGDNLYRSTLNSGDATVQDITTDGGYMNTGVLEMSNVDLSRDFTEMITTQRGFQANSRIITVSDTLLEELTNLKR